MGPHSRMGIYVRFQSPSILKYLEPLTCDLFTTRFADCIFNDDHFLVLGGDNKFINDGRKLIWMMSLYYPLTHVQRRLNFKFRKF
jgi:hypothetical protein